MIEPSDERLGIVRFQYGEKSIPLRFTWARIDAVGRTWIVEKFQQMVEGAEGCQGAMAEMLHLASAGELTVATLLSEDGPQADFEAAFSALESAWALARFGPSRRPAEDGAENPRKSRLMWLKPFSWLLSRRG